MAKNELMVALEAARPEIVALAAGAFNPNRAFAIVVETAKRPELARCSKLSMVAAVKRMAELGTERVGAGGVWLVPYGDQATVIPDWRLLINRAREAGVVKHVFAEVVREGDTFAWERGFNSNLTHKPGAGRGAVVAAYCVIILSDGEKDFAVMDKAEIDAVRKRSRAGDKGPWVTDYNEMAKKTVVRRALKAFAGADERLTRVLDADRDEFDFDLQPDPIADVRAVDEPKPKKAASTEKSEPTSEKASEPPETPEVVTPRTEEPPANPLTNEPTDDDRRAELQMLLLTQARGDNDAAAKALEDLTAFKGRDGEWVKGVRNIKFLKGTRLAIALRKARGER